MQYLNIEISDIKNVKHFKLDIPLKKGLYAIVGSNGSGKSTIMQAISQLVRKSSLNNFNNNDFSNQSYVEFTYLDKTERWENNGYKWRSNKYPSQLSFEGFYEGSIFYGTRFRDAQKVEVLLRTNNFLRNVVDADKFVKDKLSYILHDNENHYRELKRLKTREIAKKYGLEGNPYFLESNGKLISQFNMSSGECMLITLLHFVYNVLVRRNYKQGSKVIFFIDEIELALHPSAINRLVFFLEEFTKSYELIVYFSTHSSELIRKVKPRNIFQIENNDGEILVNNPCYPSYAIRDLYTNDGFDYLLLVEDELAKKVVYKMLYSSTLFNSNLVHVLPSGDWHHTLKLHLDLERNTVLGIGRQVISILDGDVVEQVNRQEDFKNLRKLFLPIQSIEKYLYKKLIEENDKGFQKFIGDRYFRTRSLSNILNDYKLNYIIEKDKNGKNLYEMLLSNLHKTGISEEEFIKYFCDDLYNLVDFSKFKTALECIVNRYTNV